MFVPYVQNKSSPDFFNGLAFPQNLGYLKKEKKIQRYLTHFKYSFSSFFLEFCQKTLQNT